MGHQIGKNVMKIPILYTIIFMGIPTFLSAGSLQEAFLKAHKMYNKGDYAQALTLYESIEPKGTAVWYNMGNCCYSLEKYPEAIAHWMRAQKQSTWKDFSTLDEYINRAYEKSSMARDVSFLARLHRILLWGTRKISPLGWQILFLLMWFICWGLLISMLSTMFSGKNYLIIIGFGLLMAGLIVGFLYAYRVHEYPQAIVTKNSISVYAGPGQDYSTVAQAQLLDMMRIYEQRDGWLKVYRQREYGWVKIEDLAIL